MPTSTCVMDAAWHWIECQGVFASVMPISDTVAVSERRGPLTAACLVQRQSQPPTGLKVKVLASRSDLGVLMTSRDEQDDAPRRTEDLMREAPPSSVLGDVEDAVAPDDEGDLTPWSPPGGDEEDDA